jgi:hypothetical protein
MRNRMDMKSSSVAKIECSSRLLEYQTPERVASFATNLVHLTVVAVPSPVETCSAPQPDFAGIGQFLSGLATLVLRCAGQFRFFLNLKSRGHF